MAEFDILRGSIDTAQMPFDQRTEILTVIGRFLTAYSKAWENQNIYLTSLQKEQAVASKLDQMAKTLITCIQQIPGCGHITQIEAQEWIFDINNPPQKATDEPIQVKQKLTVLLRRQ